MVSVEEFFAEQEKRMNMPDEDMDEYIRQHLEFRRNRTRILNLEENAPGIDNSGQTRNPRAELLRETALFTRDPKPSRTVAKEATVPSPSEPTHGYPGNPVHSPPASVKLQSGIRCDSLKRKSIHPAEFTAVDKRHKQEDLDGRFSVATVSPALLSHNESAEIPHEALISDARGKWASSSKAKSDQQHRFRERTEAAPVKARPLIPIVQAKPDNVNDLEISLYDVPNATHLPSRSLKAQHTINPVSGSSLRDPAKSACSPYSLVDGVVDTPLARAVASATVPSKARQDVSRSLNHSITRDQSINTKSIKSITATGSSITSIAQLGVNAASSRQSRIGKPSTRSAVDGGNTKATPFPEGPATIFSDHPSFAPQATSTQLPLPEHSNGEECFDIPEPLMIDPAEPRGTSAPQKISKTAFEDFSAITSPANTPIYTHKQTSSSSDIDTASRSSPIAESSKGKKAITGSKSDTSVSKPKTGKKLKEKAPLMTPLEYAQRLQAKFELDRPRKTDYLKGKCVFYVGGDMQFASPKTRGRMEYTPPLQLALLAAVLLAASSSPVNDPTNAATALRCLPPPTEPSSPPEPKPARLGPQNEGKHTELPRRDHRYHTAPTALVAVSTIALTCVGTLLILHLTRLTLLLEAMVGKRQRDEDGDAAATLDQAQAHAQTDNDRRLPFPGKRNVDGSYEVRYLDLNQPRTTLQDWCKEFGTPYSGTIAALKQRLREFSCKQDEWSDLLPGTGAQRTHKGPQPNAKRARTKVSTQRREILFENLPTGQPADAVAHALPSERSKDTRTPEEIAKVIPWFTAIAQKYPYRPPPRVPTSVLSPAFNERNAAPPTALTAWTTPLVHTDPIYQETAELKAQVALVNHQLALLRAGMANQATEVPASTPTPSDPLDCPVATTDKSSGAVVSSSPDVVAVESVAAEPLRLDHRKLIFRDGAVLTFTSSDVPDPVAVSFADNIPRLNAMWDDVAPHWGHESVLHVKGVPIPIVYWPDLYKYWKGEQWKGTKSKWHEWKFVVQRWREAGSPDAFWELFSINGKRMTYTAINNRLRKERIEADKRDAARARAEHSADFSEKYKYRRGPNWYIMTDDTSIANRFRELERLGTQANGLSST